VAIVFTYSVSKGKTTCVLKIFPGWGCSLAPQEKGQENIKQEGVGLKLLPFFPFLDSLKANSAWLYW
jgi:hypothetical protein